MRKKYIFFMTFLLAVVVFLAHWWVVGSTVWGDGRFYYAYVRSLVIDGNLNFTNEMKHWGESMVLTKTGMVANKYALGPAIFWLPGFLIAHLIVRGDGYSQFYQLVVGLSSVFWGILGLWFCWRTACFYFSEKNALLATFSIWLATNLFFYTAVDPINSHAVSFFVASVVACLALGKNLGQSGKLGILRVAIGVLGMIRPQDLIFTLPIGVYLLKKKINFIKIINFIIFITLNFYSMVNFLLINP